MLGEFTETHRLKSVPLDVARIFGIAVLQMCWDEKHVGHTYAYGYRSGRDTDLFVRARRTAFIRSEIITPLGLLVTAAAKIFRVSRSLCRLRKKPSICQPL